MNDKTCSFSDVNFVIESTTNTVKLKNNITVTTIGRLINVLSSIERERDDWPNIDDTLWNIEIVNNEELNDTKL
jgi:hypothetical protein